MIYFLIVIQVLLASGTHLVAKAVVGDVEPVALTLLRTCVSTAALAFIFIVREKKIKIRKEDYGMMLWLSFIVIPLNQFLFLYGIKYTTAANASLLYATTPVLVLVFSHFVLREKLTSMKIGGVLTAFCGVTLVIFEHGVSLSSDYTFGNIIMFVAVIAWSLYTIQGKPMVVKYGAFHVASLSMIGGMILFLPLGIYGLSRFDLSTLTAAHWEGILYLGLGTSVASYFLWYYALGKMETTKVAIFANAQPIVTSIFSYFFFHQFITVRFAVGAVVTLVGVVLTELG
ncbi:MAG TPA: DMT family transporter [Bacteroidota bacterium]|nr:DMT family transporter [Bacteroidota bacterium]